jgi:cytoskeletal protein CcmA (bactofilin family)
VLDTVADGLKNVLSGKPASRKVPALNASRPTLHHGDLHVGSSLHVTSVLVVTGNLTVDGFLRDCGPDSTIVVGGNLRARNLYTDGQLCVRKLLKVDGIVYGYYNDNTLSASVIQAPVVVSDEHDIQAQVKAKVYIENGDFRGTEPALLKRLIPEVVVRGAVDNERLEEWLVAGESVLR